MPITCRLHITSRGNLFLRDLAQLLCNVLVDVGVTASVVTDGLPTGESGVADIIVGPHEYFVVDSDLPLDRRQEIAAAAIMLTTEQPGSPFWAIQRDYCTVAPATIDINATAVAAFATEGLAAHRLRLGYHPSLDLWGGSIEGTDTGRDIDATFLGGATPRHLQMLGSCGEVLAHRSTRLLFHDPMIPVRTSSPWFVAGLEKAALLRRTKLLLNVHNSDTGYFEWIRAIEAICNGALLVSEPSPDLAPLEAFRHLVVAEPELFPAHITALLADEPRRVAMAQAAYDVLRTDLRMTDHVRTHLLPLLEDQATRSSPVTVTNTEFTRLDPDRPRGPAASPDTETTADLRQTTTRLLTARLESQDRRRALARAEATLAGRDPDRVDELATAAWAESSDRADISVIVAVHNRSGDVAAALDSVFSSRGVVSEAIVVDDGSTDGSADELRAYVDEHPDRPVLGLVRTVGAGPTAARNLARSRARAPRLFLLDAENRLFPDGLARLQRALDDGGGARVAYGILESRGDVAQLASSMPWSVESLVLRSYIESMVLLERSLVDEVEGFSGADIGLEHYQLYVSLAARGETPVWVPEIVGTYRVDTTSAGAPRRIDPSSGLRTTPVAVPRPTLASGATMTTNESTAAPADAAERLHDAEEALRTFYERLVEAEHVLAVEAVRADTAEMKLAEAEARLAAQDQELGEVRESEVAARARVAELDEQISRALEEIDALHNSVTMRAAAVPRRIYAKLRS